MARLYHHYRRLCLQNKVFFAKATCPSTCSLLADCRPVRGKLVKPRTVNTWNDLHVKSDLERSIGKDLKSGNMSTVFEKLEEADRSSLLRLPKRVWGSVFYSFNQNEDFGKLDKIRAKTKDLNINCGEGAYTTLIRSYVKRKQAVDAVNVLEEMKNGGQLRHTRTYVPVIASLAANGYQKKAFQLFGEMQHHTFKSNKDVTLSIPSSMATALVESCIQSETVDYNNAKDVLLWYNHCGQPLTLQVLNAVKEWLDNDPMYNWITNECVISNKGLCSNCGQFLHSGQLTSKETDTLKLDISNAIEDMFKLGKTKQREKFESYIDFLKQCDPCDIIIDGMNIGLSSNVKKRNNRFNVDALLKVLSNFLHKGKKVLVLLNSSVQPSFIARHVKYFVTDVGDDDLFIMYACATWSMLPFLITRDKFRDHRFLLAFQNHASYLKWVRSHTIRVGVKKNTLTFHRQKYDPVVQIGDASWHFPTTSGRWFCAKKEAK